MGAAAPWCPEPPTSAALTVREEPSSRGRLAVGILLIVTALVLSGLFFVLKGPLSRTRTQSC